MFGYDDDKASDEYTGKSVSFPKCLVHPISILPKLTLIVGTMYKLIISHLFVIAHKNISIKFSYNWRQQQLVWPMSAVATM